MKEITMYEADDGSIHKTPEGAQDADKLNWRRACLETFFIRHYDRNQPLEQFTLSIVNHWGDLVDMVRVAQEGSNPSLGHNSSLKPTSLLETMENLIGVKSETDHGFVKGVSLVPITRIEQEDDGRITVIIPWVLDVNERRCGPHGHVGCECDLR